MYYIIVGLVVTSSGFSVPFGVKMLKLMDMFCVLDLMMLVV